MKKLFIIGAGGFGREVAAILPHSNQSEVFSHAVFIDDAYPPSEVVNGKPIAGGIDWLCENHPEASVVIALGDVKLRRKIIDKLAAFSFKYPSIIHNSLSLHNKFMSTISDCGVFISEGVIITTNVNISSFCVVHPRCVLHHDTSLGVNTTLMTGTLITAGAKFGKDCFVGSGSIIATRKTFSDKTILNSGSVT